MKHITLLLGFTILTFASAIQAADAPAWATKDLRCGIIGTDTSHVPAFTQIFNKTHPEWRIKIVAAVIGKEVALLTVRSWPRDDVEAAMERIVSTFEIVAGS